MPTPQIWLTDEKPPRPMVVLGTSAIDPDCLVAYFVGDSRPLWILKPSGFVCGQEGKVYAKPAPPTEAT